MAPLVSTGEIIKPQKIVFLAVNIFAVSIENAIMSPKKMTADLDRHNRVKIRPSWVKRI